MSLLLPILLNSACPSTHHKLAIDALRFLRGERGDDWRDLFLRFYKPLLAGAKAPDDELQDFQNHVLFVGDRAWGGAADAAREKFELLAAALSESRWADAAFAAGLLSHYVSEPFLPLNTRQSEVGNLVQPAVEWCVNRSYGQLQSILEDDLGGYPAVELPAGDRNLELLLDRGAKLAAEQYEPLIDHFDIGRVHLDPDDGLDQELQDRLAVCLGAAAVSIARVWESAIAQADVAPPRREISPSGLIASLKSPFRLLACRTYDQLIQRQLDAMYEEFELTGRVTDSLPPEQREVRRRYAEEVLRVSTEELTGAELATCGQKYGTGAKPRHRPNRLRSDLHEVRPTSRASQLAGLATDHPFGDTPAILKFNPRISRTSPIEDAPMLTPRQAARLRATAIDTIGDLIAADPVFLAERLRMRRDEAETVVRWQAEGRDLCAAQGIKGPATRLDAAKSARKAA